jgi:mono/diheme cytochrome c family protein
MQHRAERVLPAYTGILLAAVSAVEKAKRMNSASPILLFGLALGCSFLAPTINSVAADSIGGGLSAVAESADGYTSSTSAQGAALSDGVYSASQAERGKVVYEESCSSCHGPSLRGGANEFGAPALAGPFFYEKWAGRTLEDLFRYASENMPPEEKKLPQAAYLDVTAYVLQVSKYPAGPSDLTATSSAMQQKIEPRQ